LGKRGITVIQYVSTSTPKPSLGKHCDAIADTIRAQFPTLGIVGDTAVTSISRRNK